MDAVQEAIIKCKQLLETAIAAGDKAGEAYACDNLSQIYCASGEYQKALEFSGRFAEITNATGDKAGEVSAYYGLGNISRARGLHHQAIKNYEKGLSIATEVSDKELEGAIHFEMGNVYRKTNDFLKAIKHHKESLQIATSLGNKTGERGSLCNLGEVCFMMGDFLKAIEYHEKHLAIAKETSNENSLRIAYTNLGLAYFGLGKYEKAIEYHKISLKIAKHRADKYGERCAYTNLGAALEELARHKEALEYHEKSLQIAKETRDRKGEGKCYGNMSNVHLKMGNLQMSFEYAQKDLEIAVEIGDKHGEGKACGNLGIASNMLGKPKQALEFLLKHLQISKELHDRHGEMKASGNLGSSYSSLGNYMKAVQYHKEYLDIAKEIHAKHAEAKAYANLGGDYMAMGQYIQAIEFQKKALDAAQDIGDRHLEGSANGNLGLCYQHVGEYNDAMKYSTKYLEIVKESEDKIAEANAHQELGDIYFTLGKDDESIIHYEACLSLAKVTGSKQQEARAYGSLGSCYGIAGKYDEAVNCHQKDLEIVAEIGDRKGESKACQNIGNAYLFSQKYDEAQKHSERSLHIAKEIGDKQGEAVACLSLGICCHHLSMQFKEAGDEARALAAMKQSENYFLESIKCNEWLFHNLEEEDRFKISIVDTYIHSYQLLIGKYIATEETEKALLVSEKKRGQALEDILKVKYNLQKSTIEDGFHDYAGIKNKVLSHSSCLLFYSKLLVPLGKSGDNVSGIGTWVLDSESLPHFEWKKTSELRSLVKNSDLSDDKGSALDAVVGKAYNTMSVRGATECEDRSIDGVNRNTYDFEEEIEEDYLEVLYDALITPVEDKLTGEEIIIIPDGPLFKVPFAALRNPRTNKYLSENKRIRLAPSLTTLKILKESHSGDSHCMKGALIVGDPDVTGERMLKGKKTKFTPLQNARIEAERISGVLGVTPLTGVLATKNVIKKRLQEGIAVVHFAAHGDAERGEIVLSPDIDQLEAGKVPDENDYLLTINEVQEIGLRAKLVVLSCCHSGRGEIKSEGVVGMSRAFFAAGALAVVASLWAVDDLGTRVFMEKFYGHLKRGEKASVSLQQAMKEMRDIERYSRPMYWAPFFLIGEDVTIDV